MARSRPGIAVDNFLPHARCANEQDALRAGDVAMKSAVAGRRCAHVAMARVGTASARDSALSRPCKAGTAPPAEWKHVRRCRVSRRIPTTCSSTRTARSCSARWRTTRRRCSPYKTEFDPHQFPTLSWRWKVARAFRRRTTPTRRKEDSPLRVMVAFEGDTSKLSLKDKIASSVAQIALRAAACPMPS